MARRLRGALGVLEEGAQTLSASPALVYFVQVTSSSTHFSELRLAGGLLK